MRHRAPTIFLVSATLLILCAVGVLLAFSFFSGKTPRAEGNSATLPGASVANAPQNAAPAAQQRYRFRFRDDSVAAISDDRSDVFTFYVGAQLIGAVVLRPAEGEQDFATWAKGLGGKLRIGDTEVSISEKSVAGRQAIAFKTSDGRETGANLITEVDGAVLWLQSRGDEAVLEQFLQKLVRVERAST